MLIYRGRIGKTTAFILEKDERQHLVAALKPILSSDTILCTDGSKGMSGVAHKLGITNRPVNLSAGIRVITGVYQA